MIHVSANHWGFPIHFLYREELPGGIPQLVSSPQFEMAYKRAADIRPLGFIPSGTNSSSLIVTLKIKVFRKSRGRYLQVAKKTTVPKRFLEIPRHKHSHIL